MAECPGGRTNRGTRSQFRLGTPGLGLFKGLHPIHLGDIMDVKQSPQTGVLSARDLVSPSKGTRTLTVREYEQTIDELKKENFDLKLRLHLLEESTKKFSCKDKDACSPDKNTVQVVVQLKLETESLRQDLAYKEKVLQDALEQVEKYKLDFKELEEKYIELQNDLSSLSELPSKQEFLSLLEEKENLLKQAEFLEQTLTEKDQEINNINEKVEILANQNILLEEKIKKRSLAIQSFVYKNFKEKEMFPDELRNIVLSATQAAKNQNKENLAIAVKSFNSVLNKIMSSSVQKLALNESEEKENIRSPHEKCLEEETLEKSSTFLPSQTESFTEMNRIQGLKEVLTERNTPDCKRFHSVDSAVLDLYMKGKMSENSVNVPEKDILECIDFSAIPVSSVAEENLVFSDKHCSQLCSVGKNNLLKIETLSSPLISSGVMHDNGVRSKSDASIVTGTAKGSDELMIETEKLRHEVKDNFAVIQTLRATCKEWEQKATCLQENDALKASKYYSMFTQTDITGSNLLNEYELTKLQNDAKLSSNVDELREDVLRLLLAIQDKNQELGDVKQTLSAVQEDLNKALNSSMSALDKEYVNERNELHQSLAFSCSVNVELMKHLRNLETFMEELLQHKFDSSMESINEKFNFFSDVSKCLNESLALSNVLSDRLSICEGSKLFEDCESVFYKSGSYSEDKSFPSMNLSEINVPDQHSTSFQGTHLAGPIPFVKKSDERMGKELDGSQLCWRCWQELDSSLLNKAGFSHLTQNNVSPKFMPYPSSDSDIWSEPDRNVSMQRIGISLQNSPVASKSPRKLRFKEKRMSHKLSSDMNTSSSEVHHWPKQRRHGSVSRRLFSKESIKMLDFTSEKFYFLLAEKYSKLKTLLETLESLKDSGVSDEVWIKMNAVVACLGEALQKLHIAKENGKSLPSAICGKCVMLELFMDLKTSHKTDFFIDDSLSENEILQQFQREVLLLKEVCKESFALFPESADMRSQSTQSDTASDYEQVKMELEDAIVDLNGKNRELHKSLEEVKGLLSKEKELLESVKLEKLELSNQINSLEEQLCDVRQKENKLSLQNEDLVKELERFHTSNLKLNFTFEDLDKKKRESSVTQEELTSELEKKKLDFTSMKGKCEKYEKQLNEQIQLKLEFQEKLRSVESALSSEIKTLNNNIRDLNTQIHSYQNELEGIRNRKFTLEKENATLSANLKSKSSEISSLQETINLLKTCKDRLSDFPETVEKRSQSTQSDYACNSSEEIKISELEDAIVDTNVKNKRLTKSLEEAKILFTKEREVLELLKSENLELSNQINSLKEELLVMKEKEKTLYSNNEELIQALANVNRHNSELNSALQDMEEKRKEPSVPLNQLTTVLEKNKVDLIDMNEKCLEYEKQLKEQLLVKEDLEKNSRNLKSTQITEKETLNNSIKDFNSEKPYEQELESIENRKLALEKENSSLSANLKSKCSEIASLQEKINMLQTSVKTSYLSLENDSKKSCLTQSEFDTEQNKISELEDAIVDLKDKNKNLHKSLEAFKMLLSKEKEMLESVKCENWKLSNQINNSKEELLVMKQKEEEISLKNKKLIENLISVNKNNLELNSALNDLEMEKKQSNAALDQLTADFKKNKLDLVNMSAKLLEYEKELNEQMHMKEEYEKKLRDLESSSVTEKDTLYKKINHLSSEKSYYQKELKRVENEKLALEKEKTALSTDLESKCCELSALQEKICVLQEAREALCHNYRELQSELEFAKGDFHKLQERCSVYEEEVLVKFQSKEEDFCQQLKQFETESQREKEKLLMQISELTRERETIFKKLNVENDRYETLLSEKNELNQNFVKSCEQISSYKLLNEELKNRQQNLLQKNEFFEKALLSSNAECNSLSNDLKCMRETLQSLEAKCVIYEKELASTAGMKDSLVECLLNINSEFSANRRKLNEMCKVYSSVTNVEDDETSVFDFIPVIDEDCAKKLCENMCFESKGLLQSVDMLLDLLKTFHLKSKKAKSSEEKLNLKTSSLRKELEYYNAEREHLKSQNSHLQQVIDELHISILEKEKYIQHSAYEIECVKEKINKSAEEIAKGNELLKRKDDEITVLQERVFNLQSYVNTTVADKTDVQNKSPRNTQIIENKADSLSSASQLPFSFSLKQVSKAIQTNELGESSQSTDESSMLESSKRSCCEKYMKKSHSLQTKVILYKKHVEILEKEKNELKERYLNQLQSKNTSSSEKGESVNINLVDLESKLEQKKAFINELKAELLKTCNSLIDKEKEVDDLKEKLSEYARKPKCAPRDMSDHSIGSSKTVDANIKGLRNYKWKLIQTIFDIQRKFYEMRGIHLNYFDRFKDHVNNLYSMQLTHALLKSESMPLLGSRSLKQLSNQREDEVKNLVGLELDIECLENLKIFLNRFFVPCVLQTSQNSKLQSPDLESVEKRIPLDADFEKMNSSEQDRKSSLGISFPECVKDHLLPEHVQSFQNTLSIENFASNVSHHLDCIESFFAATRKCQWLESLDLSVEESGDKEVVKLLLLKIFENIQVLQEGADKLFSFNAQLKNFDFVAAPSIPLVFSRPDVSDKESVMSEETIGISRSESPLSFEELCPVKLPSPETLKLEEKTVKPKSLNGKVTVTEPYSVKVTTIGSSCDSVCQRSHYSSPDLGIESDPNHESSAPEQKDEGINKYQMLITDEKKFILKSQQKTAFTSTESAGRFSGVKFGETLYSIGKLPHYELLKKEIQESLVGIKSVLSRTGDGLHHIAKYTSPRKTLEYSTLKAIKDSCANIEVCLKGAYSVIGKFWIAACPTEKEWKALNEENQDLIEQLTNLRAMTQKQEGEFKKAMGRLEHAQLLKSNMEKKISKKLVKTKKVIRQAELKLLENRCQNLRPVPKYPSEQANLVQ